MFMTSISSERNCSGSLGHKEIEQVFYRKVEDCSLGLMNLVRG